MEIVLSFLVIVILLNIISAKLRKKNKECLTDFNVMQSPLFLILGVACLIVCIIIVILFFTFESEDEIVAIILSAIFCFLGFLLLLFRKKMIKIDHDKFVYQPVIGKEVTFSLEDISYIECKKENIIIYDNNQKKICNLNCLMINYIRLLQFFKDNGIKMIKSE